MGSETPNGGASTTRITNAGQHILLSCWSLGVMSTRWQPERQWMWSQRGRRRDRLR
jgi:hypothetical protein